MSLMVYSGRFVSREAGEITNRESEETPLRLKSIANVTNWKLHWEEA